MRYYRRGACLRLGDIGGRYQASTSEIQAAKREVPGVVTDTKGLFSKTLLSPANDLTEGEAH